MTPPFAITALPGSSLANRTGTWRTERPVYVDRLPRCNHACPAGEDIQQWLFAAAAGEHEAAWRSLMEDNPLPAVMGRICYHPCESSCNRAEIDQPVAINAVERFLGDMALDSGWTVDVSAPRTGQRVLVVGSGPAGLAAAYHLRRRGHDVVIREAAEQLGGMMRYGIPRYRLPREILDAEIARILAMGVVAQTGAPVHDLVHTATHEGFDAVFVAVGAHVARHADIPAQDSARMVDALTLLRQMEHDPPRLGRRVVVYGGGDTAMDAARTARRLGAGDALVVYRRTRERMPAHAEEIEEAQVEGVRVRWLSTIAEVGEDSVMVERMRLDDTGFPQPTGEFERLDADCVVLALGQEADLSLLDGVGGVAVERGAVAVDAQMMTGRPGVFAGGDAVTAERTATVAAGHGKHAARGIDAWLRGATRREPPRHDLAEASGLNTWYYPAVAREHRPRLPLQQRLDGFAEVVAGLDLQAAEREAQRCLSCGNCFSCDTCYAVCPDNAIVKMPGDRYAVDLDYCKGCGLCAVECPCGAIAMVPESL